jgi:3-hydroxyacyl-CoA dehydrogenase
MTAINDVTDLSIHDGIAVLTSNYPPVNALGAAVRDGIVAGVAAVLDRPDCKALILICAGRTFFVGADIKEFNVKPMRGASLKNTLSLMENSPKPILAAIHGIALGGGLELALCAHYRVAVPSARFGLPEVNIGILPGAGGTQRLPRVMGVERSLDLLTSGAQVGAAEALESGLIDAIVPEDDLLAGSLEFLTKALQEGREPVSVRDRDEKLIAARARPEVFSQFRRANTKRLRGFEAPEKIIQCVEAAVNLPFDEGLKVERRLYEELLAGAQAAALRYHFFALRQIWKVPDIPAETPRRDIHSVGVVGAGTMGGGIAIAFANANLPVTVVERSAEALERGLGVVRTNYLRSARNGRFSVAEAERRIGLITGSTELSSLANADLIVEAVFENMEVKQTVFRQLDSVAKPGAILGTNTSVLNINEIAAQTQRPQDVIGLHFFSPAHVMKLVEVVRAARTSRETVATAMQVAKSIGKVGVLVGVCHGFVGNRMLLARIRETDRLVLEGCMPWDLDRVLVEFGFPMGLFQMHDLAGLDLSWKRETSSSSTLKEVLCETGRVGQKAGAGYYDYDAERRPTRSPIVEEYVRKFAAAAGEPRPTVNDDDLLTRMIYPMINEGARILEEGLVSRPSDIDVIWTSGYGWPTYRGGPMYYADQIGLDKILATLRERAETDSFWKPAPLLEKLASEGRGFSSL